MVDLLSEHRNEGRRFEPLEFIEEGQRVAVRMKLADPSWRGETVEVFKVFTFGDAGAVLMQDCIDRDDALAKLEDALGER